MPRSIRAASLMGLILWAAASASAQTSEVLRESLEQAAFTLRADAIEYEQDRDLYVASGNVRIEQTENRWLTADWLAFNATTRMGVASGNVVLVDETDRIQARFAAVNLDTLVALLADAELEAAETGFIVEGETIEKLGDQTYHIEQGLMTTCRCPPGSKRLPFEVQAKRTDIRVGGYAVARDVFFRVLGVPVAYTPWLMLPVKTERQSGFLFPNLGSASRGGRKIELPFFWAARSNVNVMLRPRWFSKRGFGGAVDVEYLFGEEGYGEGSFAALPGDDDVKDTDPDTQFSDNRWAFWLRHDHPLGPGLRAGLDLLELSDNNYALDFSDVPEYVRNLRFAGSRAWTSAAGGSLLGSVELVTLDDLQAPNNLDRDHRVLHRLPDVLVASLPRKLGPLPIRGALDFRYTYFHQKEHSDEIVGISPIRNQFYDTGLDGLFNVQEPDALGGFPHDPNADQSRDDVTSNGSRTEGNGLYDEGELLADRGHRIDFYPRLTLPHRLGPVETLAEVGFRETLYFPLQGDSETRELWTGRFDVRTRLQRPYRLGGLPLHHVVEPYVELGFVSRQSQSDNPLFVPQGSVLQNRLRARDSRVRLRNPTDRVADEQFVLTGVTNRLFAPPARPGEAARQIAEVWFGTGYDFEEDRMVNVYLEAEIRPTTGASIDVGLGYDPKNDWIEETLADFSWKWGPGHQLRLSYRYLREVSPVFENYQFSSDVFNNATSRVKRVNQFGLDGRYALTPRFDLFGNLVASFEDSRLQRGSLGFEYHSRCDCWDLIVEARQSTRPSQTEVLVQIRLAGFGFGGSGISGGGGG